jgi:hypothetical protein
MRACNSRISALCVIPATSGASTSEWKATAGEESEARAPPERNAIVPALDGWDATHSTGSRPCKLEIRGNGSSPRSPRLAEMHERCILTAAAGSPGAGSAPLASAFGPESATRTMPAPTRGGMPRSRLPSKPRNLSRKPRDPSKKRRRETCRLNRELHPHRALHQNRNLHRPLPTKLGPSPRRPELPCRSESKTKTKTKTETETESESETEFTLAPYPRSSGLSCGGPSFLFPMSRNRHQLRPVHRRSAAA